MFTIRTPQANNFFSGTTCSFNSDGLCGNDIAGFQYFTDDKQKMTCVSGGVWNVVTQQGDTLTNQNITTPVCSAQPCRVLKVNKATSLDCTSTVESKLLQK